MEVKKSDDLKWLWGKYKSKRKTTEQIMEEIDENET